MIHNAQQMQNAGWVVPAPSAAPQERPKPKRKKKDPHNARPSEEEKFGTTWQTSAWCVCCNYPSTACKMVFCSPCYNYQHRKELLVPFDVSSDEWESEYDYAGGNMCCCCPSCTTCFCNCCCSAKFQLMHEVIMFPGVATMTNYELAQEKYGLEDECCTRCQVCCCKRLYVCAACFPWVRRCVTCTVLGFQTAQIEVEIEHQTQKGTPVVDMRDCVPKTGPQWQNTPSGMHAPGQQSMPSLGCAPGAFNGPNHQEFRSAEAQMKMQQQEQRQQAELQQAAFQQAQMQKAQMQQAMQQQQMMMQQQMMQQQMMQQQQYPQCAVVPMQPMALPPPAQQPAVTYMDGSPVYQ